MLSQHRLLAGCVRMNLEQAGSLVGIRIDQTLPSGKGNPATAQFGQKALRHRRRQRRGPPAVREVNHRAVLGDDTIDKVQVAGGPPQVSENPPGHQQPVAIHRGSAR